MVPLLQTSKPLPICLYGFEQINRYWDKYEQLFAAKILPGEYYVSLSNEMIVTVLGSCVSACIRDVRLNIGGMNHFMLPESPDEQKLSQRVIVSNSARYGNFAMEHLINDIVKQGGHKQDLEVKIIGGGKIIANMSDIGKRNIEFVMDYLATEKFSVAVADVGDIYPRKVQYFPTTGKVRVKRLRSLHNTTIVDREKDYLHRLHKQPVVGEIELF